MGFGLDTACMKTFARLVFGGKKRRSNMDVNSLAHPSISNEESNFFFSFGVTLNERSYLGSFFFFDSNFVIGCMI